MKTNSSAGPDGLPPIFYKSTATSITFPLCIMFRNFFEHLIIPREWDLSIITPIFKKVSPSDPKNYQPIALTCIACKIVESLISSELLEYFSSHNLITPHQHGFLKKIPSFLTYSSLSKIGHCHLHAMLPSLNWHRIHRFLPRIWFNITP